MQGGERPVAQNYLLQWTPSRPSRSAGDEGPSLLINPVAATAGFNVSDMVYIRQAHQIEYFAHHHWVDTPARMLEPLLLQAAMDTG